MKHGAMQSTQPNNPTFSMFYPRMWTPSVPRMTLPTGKEQHKHAQIMRSLSLAFKRLTSNGFLPYSNESTKSSVVSLNTKPNLPLLTALKSLRPTINQEEHVPWLSDTWLLMPAKLPKITMEWDVGPASNSKVDMLEELWLSPDTHRVINRHDWDHPPSMTNNIKFY